MSASRGPASVESLAATCALLTGLAGLAYSLAFLGLVVAGLGVSGTAAFVVALLIRREARCRAGWGRSGWLRRSC